MKSIIKNILCGMVIGVANIVPGISGGTMMVVLDVFDTLVYSISHIRTEFKKSSSFLLQLLIGAGVAVLLFSSLIAFLLDRQYMATNFFFIGVIVGSIPLIWGKATQDRFKMVHLLPCLMTLGIMLFSVFGLPSGNSVIMRELTPVLFFQLLIIGAVAAFCMIIPGLSGSFVMLLFGMYDTITTAIAELNIPVLIPIGVGVLIGVWLGSILIDGLLKRYPQATYFSIFGFMLGSIPAILDKIRIENAFVGGFPLVIGILALVIGGVISFLFSNEKFKEKLVAAVRK